MMPLGRRHCALAFGAAVTLLAGCAVPTAPAGPQSSIPDDRPSGQSLFLSFLHRMERQPIHPDRRASWMAPTLKKQNLLYLSDGGADEVRIYTYPGGKKAGALTKLQDPAGLCSDAAGDVWVVDSASFTIAEYAHGGTKPEATLSDAGSENPLGCSVDPTTGDLAVANVGTASGGGSLSIYTGAKGTPKKFQDSDLTYFYFCGYDDEGNLFVDGLNNSYGFVLAELPNGSGKLQTINLNGAVAFPGGVQWDGSYVAIGDQYYQGKHTSAIYQVSVSGSAGTVQGTTTLTDTCDVLQFAIASNTVVAPDDCSTSARYYGYPAGGSPTKTVSGLTYPVAAAVSLAQ
ncbi:MAG: hypothetical protein ABSF08_02070 [Candidatus Cybelea sp.]|jgi:hypothetical protein